MLKNVTLTKKQLTERIKFLAKLFELLELKHLKLKIIFLDTTGKNPIIFTRTRFFDLKEINDLLENSRIKNILIAQSKLELINKSKIRADLYDNYLKECEILYKKYELDKIYHLDFLPNYFYET